MDVCWYSVSAYDTDFISFLIKFIHAIRSVNEQFGERILNELESIESHVQEQEVWSLMAMVVNELEGVDPFIHHLFLVHTEMWDRQIMP